MSDSAEHPKPRTTTDVVFDHLHAQIQALTLLPGSRISEAEVASKFGVSRQPVRDAFNRLSNLKLVKVRPQRATVVSGFSMPVIENARFVRLAVELEAARRACHAWSKSHADALEDNLIQQRAALAADQIDDFHRLDYAFHKQICVLSSHPLAFETIEACKQQVDRLCVLSLESAGEASAILADHEDIAQALLQRDEEALIGHIRRHLNRLDETIRAIHEKHVDYFD